MKLNIPKEKAIQILRQRIAELSSYDFNAEAWKAKTVNDVTEMFPLGSSKWIQVSSIKFETYITREKAEQLRTGKETGRKLLESYIEFIENYTEVAEKKPAAADSNYQQKYTGLLQEWNQLATKWNTLVKEHDAMSDDVAAKENQIDALKQEVEQVKRDTIRHDNITIGKVLNAIKNLPVGKLIAIITVFAGLIIGAFKLGQLYQENSMNSAQYDLKKEMGHFENDMNSLRDTIKARERVIEYVRRNSDSAHVILSHMPYKEMTLDSISFNKVQRTIENAGAALHLNKATP